MQIKVSRKGREYEGRRTVQDRRRKREKEWKEIGKADMGTFLTFAQECCGAVVVVVVVVDVVFVVVRMLHIADTKIHLSHVWEGKTL